MADIIDISQAVHQSYLLKINQVLKTNKSKLDILNSSFINLSSLVDNLYNRIINQIYNIEDNLLKLYSRIEHNHETISRDDLQSINNLKSVPFIPRLKLDQILTEVSKYFQVNFEDDQEKFSLSLRNSLYLKSPRHLDKARMIIREMTNDDLKKDDKFFWDEKNENMTICRNRFIYVHRNVDRVRVSYEVESFIECYDQNEDKNILAVGCQGGHAFIIDKGQPSSNKNPLLLRYPTGATRRVALTLIKISESGKLLAFSNYNNQVFIFKDANLISEFRAEANSNRVALVNCISIDDNFATIGNRDGYVFIFLISRKAWVQIRPFVNSIQSVLITSNFMNLVVVSENMIKTYHFSYDDGPSQNDFSFNFTKNIIHACPLLGNDSLLAVFTNKILNLYSLIDREIKFEVKGVFDFMVMGIQYPNILKYWYFMDY